MRKLLVFGAMIAAASTAPAFAQDVSVSGNVTLTTDYVWRGVTQSNQDMVVQGGFDADFGNGFSAGVWASGADFNDDPADTNLELDFYGSYGFDLGGIDASVGFVYYTYPDSGLDLDFFEFNGTLAKDFGNGFALGGSLNWDPDNETVYADITADYAVNDIFGLSATYGAYLDGYGEYNNWTVGGSLALGGLDFGVGYYDSDISGAGDGIYFSIGKAL